MVLDQAPTKIKRDVHGNVLSMNRMDTGAAALDFIFAAADRSISAPKFHVTSAQAKPEADATTPPDEVDNADSIASLRPPPQGPSASE